MATKPTEPYAWALGGTATDPAAKRTNGWLDNDELPAAEANFLWQALGKWAGFLEVAFDNDGWLTLDTTEGRLEVTSDTGALHLIDHLPTNAAACVIRADQLHARGEMRLGVVTGAANEGVILSEDTTSVPLDVARLVVAPVDPALDAGVFSGTFAPELVTAPNTDYRSIFPYDGALYLGNLAKLCGQILIQDVGATGAYNTVTIAGGHNLASVALVPGTPDVISITPTDAFSATTVICTVGPQPGGTLPLPVIFGGVSHTTITAIAFVGGAWVDLFGAGVATALGVANLRLNILAF